MAVQKGYQNVYVYNEGLPKWARNGYPVDVMNLYPEVKVPLVSAQELKALIDNGEAIFMCDLRDEDDRKAGWLKGSVNIEMEFLDAKYEGIPKDKKVILMCLFGKQAKMASRYLASKGYSNIYKLDGGVVGGWIRAGYEVEK